MSNKQRLKDYYSILGIQYGEDNHNTILNAYKSMSAKLHPNKYKKGDCKDRTLEINEAYLILTDPIVKKQYDDYYMAQTKGFDVSSSYYFLSMLNPKLDQAKTYTEDFFQKYERYKSRKQKTSWFSGCLVAFLILSAIGQGIKGCVQGIQEASPPPAQKISQLSSYSTPPNWSTYNIMNAFSISIPNTMEVRKEDDPYTKLLTNNHIAISNADVVFQQRELSQMTESGYSTYCRVLISYAEDYSDEYLRHDETEEFNSETKKVFDELVEQEVAPYTMIGYPSYKWIDINGTKAVQSSYRRNGDFGPVNCKMYILFNYHEMTKIIIAYRENDSELWSEDMGNVIKTFKWVNPR